MTPAETSSPSAMRTVDQDVLALLDHALPVVLILKLSGAWLHPSFTPSDTAPGLALLNALFLAFCLYGTIRLLFAKPLAAIFSEPAYSALLVFAALAAFVSVSHANSFAMVRTAALFLGACLFIRYRFPPLYTLRLFAGGLAILMVLSIFAALATPLGIMPGFDAGRWRGVFNHKNTLGETAAIAALAAFGLATIKAYRAYLWVFAGIVASACLIMSGSATSLAAAAIGALVFTTTLTIVRLRVVPQQGYWLLLAGLITAVATSIALIEPLAASLGRDLTFTGRTEIWQQFIHYASQRPWSGWGWATISTTDNMLPLIRQILDLPHIQTPHSGYLSLLVELGYPGLLIFCSWLTLTFVTAAGRAILKREPLAAIRLAIVCALAVHSLFESTSGALPSLWLFLLFAVSARINIRWH